VGTVAHNHVLVEPRHIVIGLLAVFGGIVLGDHPGVDHGQHIGQRHDAPAVHHPVEHIDAVLRLHAPDNGSVAILPGHHLLFPITLLRILQDLRVHRREQLGSAAVAHVIGVVVQREGRAHELRIRRAVDLQPRHALAGGVVHAPGAVEVIIPVPFLAGVLLHKGDGLFDILRGVFLHIRLPVAHGGDQLEGGDAVLPLQALGDQAVAHQGAVAGGVNLHRAAAQNGKVVVDGDAGLGLGHGADVAGDAGLLGHVQIVGGGILGQQVGDKHARHLAEDGVHGGEAHHEGGHGILIGQNAFLGILHVVAGAAVASEDVVQCGSHVVNHKVHRGMYDAQGLVAQAHSEFVYHVRGGQIVCHPSVTEHGLDIAGLGDELGQNGHDVQPSAVIVQGVLQSAPLAAFADFAAVEQNTQLFIAGPVVVFSLNNHYFAPPRSFLISMLSTNACTRVRICPTEEFML